MTEKPATLEDALSEVERANIELRIAAGKLDEAMAKLAALVELSKFSRSPAARGE